MGAGNRELSIWNFAFKWICQVILKAFHEVNSMQTDNHSIAFSHILEKVMKII